MIQVWIVDENGFYINESLFKRNDDITEFDVTEPLHTDFLCVKPKWNGKEWVEGATEEEIKEWEEANKPIPQEPNEMEILQGENKMLWDVVDMLLRDGGYIPTEVTGEEVTNESE